jgi:hypothetical protein
LAASFRPLGRRGIAPIDGLRNSKSQIPNPKQRRQKADKFQNAESAALAPFWNLSF